MMHQLRSKWNETNFGMCKMDPKMFQCAAAAEAAAKAYCCCKVILCISSDKWDFAYLNDGALKKANTMHQKWCAMQFFSSLWKSRVLRNWVKTDWVKWWHRAHFPRWTRGSRASTLFGYCHTYPPRSRKWAKRSFDREHRRPQQTHIVE